jgi:hypothetical protein
LKGEVKWKERMHELVRSLDTQIPDPVRETEKPFLMAIEDVFSIKGRGTVVTGRIERGVIKTGEEVEIVGYRDTRKTIVTGVEMFRKLLDQGQAGDNVGLLLRGIEKEDVERGQILCKPGSVTPHTKAEAEALAKQLGFNKVSEEKLAVATKIRDYVIGGGFMFAMCSATDSFDISLAAEGVDICEPMFDGDGSEANYQTKMDYNKSFAFKNFILDRNPDHYEFSDIDMTEKRKIPMEKDYFTLMEFSAKWDPIPSMLCQNHTQLVKGFMGQTTAFDSNLIKSNVLVLGSCELNSEVRYLHGQKGKGMFTFYSGHDPEDFQHQVGDPPTVLDLHPNSPGYRLILNNVLFPAAKKKKQKTKNDYVVQDKNKRETMVSKVSKDSSKTAQQQHIYVKRDNAHCTSS